MNSLERTIGVFISPAKTFDDLKENPKVLIPIILVPIATVLLYVIFFDAYRESMALLLEEQFAAYDMELTPEMLDMQMKIGLYSTLIVTPITIVAGFVISTLFYWLLSKVAFKSKVGFMQMFSLVTHVGLISLVSVFMMGLMTVLTGTFSMQVPVTSILSVLPMNIEMGFLYGFLLPIDVIGIWSTVLMIIGLQRIAGLTKGHAIVVAGIIFVGGMLLSGGSIWVSTLAQNLG